MKQFAKETKLFIYEGIGVLILFLTWWLISLLAQSLVVPGPIETFGFMFSDMLPINFFWNNLGISAFRLILTSLIACVIGVILGILGGIFKPLRSVLKPIMNFMRATPIIIIVTIIMIYFSSSLSPFIIGAFVIIPIFYEAIAGNLDKTDESIMMALRTDGYNPRGFKALFLIRLPLIKDQFGIAALTSLGLAFKAIIAVEILTGNSEVGGLGSLLRIYRQDANMAGMFALTIIIVLIIVIFDGLIALIKYLALDRKT